MDDYTLPLGSAEVLVEGSHVTVVAWGAQAPSPPTAPAPRRAAAGARARRRLDGHHDSRPPPRLPRVPSGGQVHVMLKACERAAAAGISCEAIDLATIMPWDMETVLNSVAAAPAYPAPPARPHLARTWRLSSTRSRHAPTLPPRCARDDRPPSCLPRPARCARRGGSWSPTRPPSRRGSRARSPQLCKSTASSPSRRR